MDDLIFDIIERLHEPLYDWITVTCPGSMKARNQVFDDGWQASREALLDPTSLPKQNPMLNRIAILVVDILATYRSIIEKYNENLAKAYNVGFSPVLEKWPNLSEEFLARLSLWLMNDINFRICLTIEHCLDLNPEIIVGVTGWQNNRTENLNEAKSVFIRNYMFFLEYIKDNAMPHHLLLALQNETLNMPPRKELACMKTDLLYCTNLINANVD